MPKVLLASGGYDNYIKLWDISTKTSYRTLRFLDSQINCLQISHDRAHIIAGGNPFVRLYDIKNQSPLPSSQYDGHTSNVTSVGFNMTKEWIYTSSEDKIVRIFDIKSSVSPRSIECNGQVNCAVLHPNQAEIYSVDHSGVITIWDLSTNKKRKELEPEGNTPLQSISISPDGTKFCAVNYKGNIFLYGNDDNPIKQINGHSRYILKCAYSPNGKLFATTSADGSIKIWNSNDLSLIQEFTGHKGWIWDCVFSSDSEFILSASSDETIKIWDLKSNTLSLTIRGHTKVISSIALNDMDENFNEEDDEGTEPETVE